MCPAPAVCIGEALTVLVPGRPGPLERAEAFSRTIGGAELNVAIGLASLGIPASLITRVGDDGFGRHILSTLQKHGVNASAIETDPARSTGLYVKELGGDGSEPHDLGSGRSRMHYYRADSAGSMLSSGSLRSPAARKLLREAPFVHVTGVTAALSPDAQEMTLALRHTVGAIPLSFDVNWRPRLWRGREAEGVRVLRAVSRASDLVFLGVSESEVIFGTADPAELRLRLPEPRWLVIKNDDAAAVAFDGDRSVAVAPHAAEVREAIGAGDAFAAGYLAAFARGMAPAVALESAHSAAARALTSMEDHIGAQADPTGSSPRP
jgi:2-dehydro-3-deoxygluconokinase